jgi:hypothetical protein
MIKFDFLLFYYKSKENASAEEQLSANKSAIRVLCGEWWVCAPFSDVARDLLSAVILSVSKNPLG